MNKHTLHYENLAFAGTRGVSENNTRSGFRPAFLDKTTGCIELARLANGKPAAMHLICWLPRDWGSCFDEDGSIESLKAGVVAGFELDGVFYTRDEVAEL
tara:strand:- start:4819 stop:5118 length:300 start_codon:yes stop_codon:yes gene_type:complete